MTLFTTNKMLKQVQHDMRGFLLDSNGNAIPDKASSAGSVVASSFCLSGMTIGTVALSVLAIFIFTITPALSAFRCVECPENFFCKNGQKTACPASTPVTNGTQKSLQSDCMTCYQKTGNSATAGFKDGICTDCYTADPTKPAWNGSSCTTCLAAEGTSTPVYSDLAGRCVSCAEKDNSTPNWNGSACVGCGNDKPYFNPNTLACEACPADKPNWDGTQCVTCEDGYYEEEITCADGTEWNETSGKCESTGISITTANGSYNISSGLIFSPIGLTYAECTAMIGNSKYPEVTQCYDFTSDIFYVAPNNLDYWAGAVKHCRDQGKRLPTMQELAYLGNVLYNTIINDPYGDYGEFETISIANPSLWNILLDGEENSAVIYWSSVERGEYNADPREFTDSSTYQEYFGRDVSRVKAFCVPQ